MPKYDIFFFSSFFFLAGVGLASAGLGIWQVFLCALILGAFCLILWGNGNENRRQILWLGFLGFFVVLGAFFYISDDARFRSVELPKGTIISDGTIVETPVVKGNKQELVVALDNLSGTRILASIPPLPEFSYGDKIRIEGTIQKAEGSYGRYLEKERVRGIMNYPKAEFIEKGKTSVRSLLLKLRGNVVGTFQKLLPPEEAAFLTGLTLGGTSGFSQEFKDAMSKSGTTHLVALSGYNITIVVWVMLSIFLLFLSRRAAFFAVTVAIIGFVLLAGAEASVVRAAIMGMLVLLAREAGRIYDFRNAIVFAGLIMILWNPKVLVFDVGFQLSFLALLGIVYLRPAIMRLFKVHEEEKENQLSWKDNLITTCSAQLAVAPALIGYFGSVSLTSVPANVLVLPMVPVTMALGFIIAGLAFISYYAALMVSWLAYVLLWFKIAIIELFARWSIPISFKIGIFAAVVYYALLVAVVIFSKKKVTERS
ncbi:MAG: ComEC/Rec2 family competence protein [Patescibacteria group bacterium]